ncbi:hypothetical protein JCM10207_005060 [Rhodosporidiobolus poonsookiae]
MKGVSAFVPGTAMACVALAGFASADSPSPVDAADPLPEAAPKLEPEVASLFPETVPAVDPHAQPALPPFEGTEWKLGPFKIRPSQMKMEGVMLAVLTTYLVATVLGRKANARRAKKWFAANEEVYRREFAGVGLGKDKLFALDGGDEAVSYATGRRGVEYVWTKVRVGAHDVVARLYNIGRSIADYSYDSGAEKVVLDFKLAPPQATPGALFCFAVVKREILKSIRDDRWDLRTFTTTSEYPSLSPSLIALTESGDITSAMLKDPETGLADALKEGAEGLEYFESLVITDMPVEEPSETKPTLPVNDFHLVLTLRLPPSSQSAATQPWIELACNIADMINGKPKLIPESAVSKLKKRRTDALNVLLKPLKEEEAERAKEAKEDALALKRKMEADRRDAQMAKMSPAERVKFQQKEDEKQRKKDMRKQTKRVR